MPLTDPRADVPRYADRLNLPREIRIAVEIARRAMRDLPLEDRRVATAVLLSDFFQAARRQVH
jgi:hypothetical protein